MRLWLDEARPVPDSSWTACPTVEGAMLEFEFGDRLITECSLDHDLSKAAILELAPSGLDFVRWMIRMDRVPAKVEVHSQNPVGGGRMVWALWRAGYRVRWAPYGLGFGVTIG